MNGTHRSIFLACLLALIAAPALAADPVAPTAVSTAASTAPVKNWGDSAELSFVNTNGNSRTQTLAGKESFHYDFDPRLHLDLEGGGLKSSSQGQVGAEQYYAGEKVERKYDERDYVFEKYRWDKNRFAGVASRHEVSVGIGRELWKTSKDLVTGELAPGYLNEERIGSPRISAPTSRVSAKYEHDFTATSKFSQRAEYLQNLNDVRDSRLTTETALTTALSAHFSVKTSFTWNRSTRPPAGFQKDDETTLFSLIATF